MTISPPAPPRLDDVAELVVPALREVVGRLDPTTQVQVSYHLGWTDTAGHPCAGSGGKGVRAALALLGSRAAGADAGVGVPGAVAVELVHNFSLLHDDLMDGDTERRHRRTVWAHWGMASAILAGDALLGLAQEVLLEVPAPTGPAAAHELAVATRDLIRGQVEDMSYEGHADVDTGAVLAMAAGKTGALLGASVAVGALLAGAPPRTVAALRSYGRELGLAFQLVDDLLGIWGDPAVTGKPVRSDLRARKTSLPVAWARQYGGAPGRRLGEWLGTAGPDTEDRLREVADLVEAGGGRAWARVESARRLDAALGALEAAGAPADVHDELVALGEFVVRRQH